MPALIEVPVMPLPIGSLGIGFNNWISTPPTAKELHHTLIDEGLLPPPVGSDLSDNVTSIGSATPNEEYYIPAEIAVGTVGTLKGFKFAFLFVGATIVDEPGLKFQVFIDPLGDDNRTQVGGDIDINVVQASAERKQVTWSWDDVIPFEINLDDWIGAVWRILVITSIGGGGKQLPDDPDFEFED